MARPRKYDDPLEAKRVAQKLYEQKRKEKQTHLSIFMDKELFNKIEEISKAKGKSKTQYVIDLIKADLEQGGD